jgi:uncharacterized Fe-S cluster-containing MiaB family protein
MWVLTIHSKADCHLCGEWLLSTTYYLQWKTLLEQIKTAWNDISLEFIIKVFTTVQMLDDRNGSEDDHAEYSSSSDECVGSD